MNGEAKDYVFQQLARAETWSRAAAKMNARRPFPKRHKFKAIDGRLEKFLGGMPGDRWILVPGLRGVGKSTLLAQLYLALRERGVEQQRILYISGDHVCRNLKLSIFQVLTAYESILGEPFESIKIPIFLFVDEVQYDENWAIAIKTFFDRCQSVFIICTGSSALSLQTNADVSRRSVSERLLPMSFIEYQMLKNSIYPVPGLKNKIRDAVLNASSAADCFSQIKQLQGDVDLYWSRVEPLSIARYLQTGAFPFALDLDPNDTYQRVRELLERIADRDIPLYGSFSRESIDAVDRLLILLAAGVYSKKKLSDLTAINHITVAQLISALERAEVLIQALPIGSGTNAAKKPAKYYFVTPNLRLAILDLYGRASLKDTFLGSAYEDYVASVLFREVVQRRKGTLKYDPKEGAADFIIQIPTQRQIALEVGSGAKGYVQLAQTLMYRSCDFGLNIANSGLDLSEDQRMLTIPFRTFLLM